MPRAINLVGGPHSIADQSSEGPAPAARFDELYRNEYRGVLAIAANLVNNTAVAEELTQETFLRAHRKWNRISVHPNPEAWVRRVAINLSLSWLRRRGAEDRSLRRWSGASCDGTEFPEPPIDSWKAVRGLPRRQAQCVILFYIEDMAIAQIAEFLDVAEGTVKAHLFRARVALVTALQP